MPRPALASFLHESRLVQDKYPVGLGQILDDVRSDDVTYAVGVPGVFIQQPLHLLRPPVLGVLGERPPVLTLVLRQQPVQVSLRLRSRLVAGKTVGDTAEQLDKPGLPLRDVVQGYAANRGHRVFLVFLHRAEKSCGGRPRIAPRRRAGKRPHGDHCGCSSKSSRRGDGDQKGNSAGSCHSGWRCLARPSAY